MMDELCSTKDGKSETETSTPSEFGTEFTVDDLEIESPNGKQSLEKALCAVDFYPSFSPTEKSIQLEASNGKKQVKSVKDYMKKRMGDKFGFKFPKNGWTCRQC
jgi:hypothetical protein